MSERSSREALDRTTRLAADIYPAGNRDELADALTGFSVAIHTDPESTSTHAGQTAVVATSLLLAELGMRTSLRIEESDLVGAQPPLGDAPLAEGLVELSRDLIGSIDRNGEAGAGMRINIGSVTSNADRRVISVGADDWGMKLAANGRGMPPVTGTQPFGGILGAIAAAAEVFRAAMVAFGDVRGLDPTREHRIGAAAPSHWTLEPIARPVGDLGRVDAVSAGAITNGCLFTAFRIEGAGADLRVFDDDHVAESNLNRCQLFTYADVGSAKVEALERRAPHGWTVEPVKSRANDESATAILPWAPRVLTGVDHIPARWWVQRGNPAWHTVGATSHFEVQVSEHEARGPCAGCMHARDEQGSDPIPTISFVSAMAGLLQAYRLARSSAGLASAGPTLAYPFALDAPEAIQELRLPARKECPVGCAAARALGG